MCPNLYPPHIFLFCQKHLLQFYGTLFSPLPSTYVCVCSHPKLISCECFQKENSIIRIHTKRKNEYNHSNSTICNGLVKQVCERKMATCTHKLWETKICLKMWRLLQITEVYHNTACLIQLCFSKNWT